MLATSNPSLVAEGSVNDGTFEIFSRSLRNPDKTARATTVILAGVS